MILDPFKEGQALLFVGAISGYKLKVNVHKSSIAFEPKYADFKADANKKNETCSMQEYIFQP
jgi:hypothetical protein